MRGIFTFSFSLQILEREASSEEGSLSKLDQYEIEGSESQSELLQNLAEFHLASVSPFGHFRHSHCFSELLLASSLPSQTLYNASLENASSEQGARMSAMDNSTRNAKDMLDRLTLSYNRSENTSNYN